MHRRSGRLLIRAGGFIAAGLLAVPLLVYAAKAISDFDSTQPRGAPEGVFSDQGQDLSPVIDGFRAPQHWGNLDPFTDWAGSMMGSTGRDPAYFSTLAVANQDFINLLNAATQACYPAFLVKSCRGEADCPLQCREVQTSLFRLMVDPARSGYLPPARALSFLGLTRDIVLDPGGGPYLLQPEDILPVTADLCQRCHFPVGWLEGRSEPPSQALPFLKGQFWGASFVDAQECGDDGSNCTHDSESDMDGVQCGFCHRVVDNYKRTSLFDGTVNLPSGDGGYFVDRTDPFLGGMPWPAGEGAQFQRSAEFCGTCHDVTNPLLKTRTEGAASNMDHPLERTFTEWYWSEFREEGQTCQDCHQPMQFLGAQSWLLYPGLDDLWGAVDEVWTQEPFNYAVDPWRTAHLERGRDRNLDFMRNQAAEVQIVQATSLGDTALVAVKVVNLAGHKLPTGFSEGRQMWIYVRAEDEGGNVLFEDGVIDARGQLVRTPDSKVYEQVVQAEGFEAFKLPIGGIANWNILDYTRDHPEQGIVYGPDGQVSDFDREFHFLLGNKIVKDNRIPPRGFDKSAYTADGAFIVPRDPADTDYASGQNWDITRYTFDVGGVTGLIEVTVQVYYQTFSREYTEFLANVDREKTQEHGGRARNVPCNAGSQYCGYQTWGGVLEAIWEGAENGKPVLIGSATTSFSGPGP